MKRLLPRIAAAMVALPLTAAPVDVTTAEGSMPSVLHFQHRHYVCDSLGR